MEGSRQASLLSPDLVRQTIGWWKILGELRVRVLGPLEVNVGIEPVEIGPPKQRALLVLLALRAGHAVSADDLVTGLWGDDAPRSALKTLQTYVSALRVRLGDDLLHTTPGGYELDLDPSDLDIMQFEIMLSGARKATTVGDSAAAVELLSSALALWRGPALADVIAQLSGMAAAQRLEEMRRVATEDLADLQLATGGHHQIVADLEAAVTAEPLRERRWAQLMLAAYRCGRQAEALRAYQRLSALLADELGLRPSIELTTLEGLIIRQDPQLDWRHSTGQSNAALDGANRSGIAQSLSRTVGQDQPVVSSGWLRTADGTLLAVPSHGLRIGRAPDNDLVIDDSKASRYHASIVLWAQNYLLSDLHSTNGTTIERIGRIASSQVLEPHDAIVIGATRLIFLMEEEVEVHSG